MQDLERTHERNGGRADSTSQQSTNVVDVHWYPFWLVAKRLNTSLMETSTSRNVRRMNEIQYPHNQQVSCTERRTSPPPWTIRYDSIHFDRDVAKTPAAQSRIRVIIQIQFSLVTLLLHFQNRTHQIPKAKDKTKATTVRTRWPSIIEPCNYTTPPTQTKSPYKNISFQASALHPTLSHPTLTELVTHYNRLSSHQNQPPTPTIQLERLDRTASIHLRFAHRAQHALALKHATVDSGKKRAKTQVSLPVRSYRPQAQSELTHKATSIDRNLLFDTSIQSYSIDESSKAKQARVRTDIHT